MLDDDARDDGVHGVPEDALTPYAYLWSGPDKRHWVLLSDDESRQRGDVTIYHVKRWRVLHIDDAALHAAVVARMRAAGAPTLSDEDLFGKRPVQPDDDDQPDRRKRRR